MEAIQKVNYAVSMIHLVGDYLIYSKNIFEIALKLVSFNFIATFLDKLNLKMQLILISSRFG